MNSRDYLANYLGTTHTPSAHVSLVSDDAETSRMLRVSFSIDDGKIEWTVFRTTFQVWKMHVYYSLRHVGELFKFSSPPDLDDVPKVSWLHISDPRARVSTTDCEDIAKFLEWILGNPKARSAEIFGNFAELSPLSFHGGEKSLTEGYADKRRGGRRFTMQGCSGNVSGGIASMFRKKFQKRWFVLRRDYLVYIDTRTSTTVRDVFLFDKDFSVKLVSEFEGGKGTIRPGFLRSKKIVNSQYLQIQNAYRKLVLRFESAMEAKHWLKTIEDAYARSGWINAPQNGFDSFAPVREGCGVKLLVDGENYMRELESCLKCAQHEIYISGWWLVPELLLVRKTDLPGSSLLDILRDRAQNFGVKIFIVLYKELSVALSLDSQKTKATLEAIGPNVSVIRHPKQIGVNAVLAWSHHQKLVVIDHRVAFLGGLDLCLGRYDSSEHRLADVQSPFTFPGKDYCNPCMRDMLDVSDPFGEGRDLYDRNSEPRLPWHDVHCVVRGPVVNDIVRHFVQLWNHVKTDKHRRESDVEFLVQSAVNRQRSMIEESATMVPLVRGGSVSDTLGLGIGASMTIEDERMTEKQFSSWKDRILKIFARKEREEEEEGNVQDGPLPERIDDVLTTVVSPSSIMMFGTRVQFLRSCSWWSVGLPTEHSILNAYCSVIRSAKKFLYIENQFFVTSARYHVVDESRNFLAQGTIVRNLIGRCIAERIVRSTKNGEGFKVYLVLPIMPAFENSQLMEPSGFVTRATLQLQFESLTRGDDSILSYIAKAMPGENALEIFHNHVCVCGLRQIDRWPNGEIRTEQLYVHSKAMVVDDRIAIIGSANINDRSMLGDRDSEVAVMIEDERFVRSMRLELWREHTCVNENDVIIAEPQSEACFRLWKECSRQNSNIHKNVFGTIPADHIKTRQSFVEHMNEATGLSTVHASDERRMDLLKDLKGRLVEFQLGFLEEEHDLYNPMPTTAALCPREVFS